MKPPYPPPNPGGADPSKSPRIGGFRGLFRQHFLKSVPFKHGRSGAGKQRYKCRNRGCRRSTFIRAYGDRGYLPEVKQHIAEMALNGSGIRDTARVLSISPTTVIEALKKKILT